MDICQTVPLKREEAVRSLYASHILNHVWTSRQRIYQHTKELKGLDGCGGDDDDDEEEDSNSINNIEAKHRIQSFEIKALRGLPFDTHANPRHN
jgi:hypothetical protein